MDASYTEAVKMKVAYADAAIDDISILPPVVQKKVRKQIRFLVRSLHHPSLHAKKYDESRDIWQGRVDRQYRFYFVIENDVYVIVRVIPHL